MAALQSIVDFFAGLGEMLMSVVDFVVSFFADIVYIVKLTGEFVLQIPVYLGWLPGPVLTIIVVAFGVVVIYKVMGREG